jgi:hypothetical protein
MDKRMGHNLRTIGKVIVPEKYQVESQKPESVSVTQKEGLRWMSDFTIDKLDMNNNANHIFQISKLKQKQNTTPSDGEYNRASR